MDNIVVPIVVIITEEATNASKDALHQAQNEENADKNNKEEQDRICAIHDWGVGVALGTEENAIEDFYQKSVYIGSDLATEDSSD